MIRIHGLLFLYYFLVERVKQRYLLNNAGILRMMNHKISNER